MENLEFSLEEVFNEVRSRMQSEGALTEEEYLDLVEEVLEEKREEGLVDDDFNFKEAKEALASRWDEVAEAESASKMDEEDAQ